MSGDARPGGSIVVSHRVRNAGPARARGSTAGYYLATRPVKRVRGLRLGVRRLPPLAPGRTLRRALKLALPQGIEAGSYVLIVCADAGNRIRERREGNNCRFSRPLNMRQPSREPGPAPAAPALSDRPADPTSSTSARFSFSAAESGVTFQCSLDSPVFTSCTSPIEYTGLGEGMHAFAVRAVNTDGRTSEPTTLAWTIDLTPPHAPWFTAGPPDPTRERSASFSFASHPGATFTCRLDDAAFAPCSSPAVYPGPIAEGGHTFSVRARDAVGNASTATSYSWAIDITPPGVPILISQPDDPTNDTFAEFTFGGAPERGEEWLCSLDDGPFATCSNPQFYPGPLAQGTHRFAAFARDAVGNESPTTRFSWTVDTTPPPAPILTGSPENPSGSGPAVFTFSDTEPGVTFRCWIDGGPPVWCPSPHSYSGLEDGEHDWRVIARDEAGNWSTQTRHRWMIDTTPPPAAAFDLGVFAGGMNPGGVLTFQNWLRRPIGRALEYFGWDTWAEIEQPMQINAWTGRGYQMVYSTPMLPSSGGTLAEGATGAYNIHFQRLAQRLVAAGQGNAVIRLGWEFNGDWFPWSARDDPASFILYWRQIVTTMRNVPGSQLKFDWCTVFGPARMNADAAYPGDGYVDYIGMSLFDQDWYPGWQDPVLRWRNFINLPFGLQWQRDFARDHGKQIVFDEWALSERDDGHGGGDNPYFVQQVYRWFNARDLLGDGRRRVAWGNYFEHDKPDARHKLQGGVFPLSALRVRALFGNVFQ